MTEIKTDVRNFPFNPKGNVIIDAKTYTWERSGPKVSVYHMGKLRCTVWV